MRTILAATALLGVGAVGAALAQPAPTSPGAAAYQQHCAACHGAALTDGLFAPALKGAGFATYWNGATADKLDAYVRSSMPPTAPGSLDADTYAAIVGYLLDANGVEPNGAALAQVRLPKAGQTDALGGEVAGVSRTHPNPPWPKPADPFAAFKPVTEAELDDPAPQDWPAWRRSHLGQGFSPLAQITPANVKGLRLAWSQALPPGETSTEPLVRNGVLYMFGSGDQLFAFDAATGRQLWRYSRTLPKGVAPTAKKVIALYGDRLYAATSDLHLLALDARTGQPVWDKVVIDKPGYRSIGGPLAAGGVIMLGLTGQAPGGNLIAAFDAQTGAKLWTFDTIAQPGTPGGDTWNGLPADKRSGASVWVSGSYDPATGLALWGTAQTYDTAPVRDRKPGANNDLLYTDSTLAFDPRSGRLVWYYQHIQNDQFDLDWVFDRVIGMLQVAGKPKRVVMTAGKAGLFDALETADGRYVRTVDLGLQNFVTRIDPVTGRKTVNPALIPDRTRTRFVCPHGGGGRNWMPTAFDQRSATTYVVARDMCMDLVPTDGKGLLSTGVNAAYAAPPGSDGRFGMLRALDMNGGKVRWTARQRAPYTMGVLSTAGGLLFTGSVDRRFSAYDAANGRLLWQQTMAAIPYSSPISFAVGGRQYIAMVTSAAAGMGVGIGAMTPEIQLPSVPSAAINVFALP